MVGGIGFVWFLFFLWWGTNGVFVAGGGVVGDWFGCCGEDEWGVFTVGVWGLGGEELGEDDEGADDGDDGAEAGEGAGFGFGGVGAEFGDVGAEFGA